MRQNSESCDILLVGGGVIGLSLAWELAQHGAKVKVIDSCEMGREASWAAAGMLPPGPGEEKWPDCTAHEQLQGLSHRLHRDWHRKLANLTDIDNGYRQTGALYTSEGQGNVNSSLEKHRLEWNRWGLEYRVVDNATLAELEPALMPQSQAILLPSEAQVRTPRHLKALVTACQLTGVQLTPGCQLLGWKTDGKHITAAVTSTGSITAGEYCLTSGCWTGPLAAELGLNLGLRPIRGQILLLNGPPNTLRRIVNVGPRYLTPRPDGRVLVGSTQEEVGFNKQNTVEGLADLMSFARRMCPALGQFTLEKSWSGLRPVTADELPYLGRLPRHDNAWIAAGHFRAGIQLSAVTAVAMRALILKQTPPVDVSPLGVDRS